ncbi:MAG TPA: amidohydrolase family protein [Armatimonadota bacterium]
MNEITPLMQEFRDHGRSAACPVIDTHAHYGPWYAIYFPHADETGMLKDMDRSGVRLTVCSAHASFPDPPRGNALMREVVRRHPDRFRAYWTVNPHYRENMAADLEALADQREFVGVKLHPGMCEYPLDGEGYRPVFEWAEATGRPVLTHTWGGSPTCGPGPVRAVLERYPQTRLLLGHCCSGQWAEAIGIARDFPNTYLDLCGTVEHNGLIEEMVGEVGAHRILFGTDLPWFDPHYGIGCILWARISDADRHAILHGNAEKLLGLG